MSTGHKTKIGKWKTDKRGRRLVRDLKAYDVSTQLKITGGSKKVRYGKRGLK